MFIGGQICGTIDTDYLNKTPNLQKLGVADTKMELLPNLSHVPKLTYLGACCNELTSVKMEEFWNNGKLNQILSEGNNLQEIPNFKQLAKQTDAEKLKVDIRWNELDCSGNNLCWLKTIP